MFDNNQKPWVRIAHLSNSLPAPVKLACVIATSKKLYELGLFCSVRIRKTYTRVRRN